MLLHCVRNEEVFPPAHLPAYLRKSRSITPRKHHSTADSKRCRYLPKVTQEIHARTEISQVPYLRCSCGIPPTLSVSDKYFCQDVLWLWVTPDLKVLPGIAALCLSTTDLQIFSQYFMLLREALTVCTPFSSPWQP